MFIAYNDDAIYWECKKMALFVANIAWRKIGTFEWKSPQGFSIANPASNWNFLGLVSIGLVSLG